MTRTSLWRQLEELGVGVHLEDELVLLGCELFDLVHDRRARDP